jgi:ABC-type sugar transport system ATPase subunit
MLGSVFEDKLQQRPARPDNPPTPLLSLKGIAVSGLLHPVDLEIRAGEVLGIAGLVGSGRTSLLRAIAGLERAQGAIEIDGQCRSAPHSPRAARALGIALVPEDRKRQGLVLGQSSAANVVLGDLGAVANNGFTSKRDTIKAATKALAGANFDVGRLSYPARSLSGGNQQKLVLGRWRHARPRLLLADEPTRGIDVGAKTEILSELRQRALDEGLAVVIVSSELEEVLAISDRIAVMRDGRIVAELDCHERDLTVQDLLNSAFGVGAAEPGGQAG